MDGGRDPVFDEEEVLQDHMETLDICSSLIIIRDGTDRDESVTTKIVVLAHYSVKEYLLSDRIRGNQILRYSIIRKPGHSMLARDCLGDLQQTLQILLSVEEALETAKFLHYCAEYWMDHAEDAGDCDTETAQSAARFLSVENTAYKKWLQIYSPERSWRQLGVGTPTGMVAHTLYYAALFGLAAIAGFFLKEDADVNAPGGQCGSALQAAAGSGHEQTVELLLAYGANVDTTSQHHGSAFQAASELGHERVVKLLIDEGADVNAYGGLYGSALDLAISNDHGNIIALLLKNGAGMDLNHTRGGPRPTFASFKGYLNFTKLLSN